MIKSYDLEALCVALDAAHAATMRAASHDWPVEYYLLFRSLSDTLRAAEAILAAHRKLPLDNNKQQGDPRNRFFDNTKQP